VLDELAQIEKDDVVGDAAGLPQDMGHDHDGVILLQLHEPFLDVLARLGIEGRGRLVAQDDLRPDGQSPGQAQPLLLADGEAGSRVMEPPLHLFPQPGDLQVVLDDPVQLLLVLDAMNPGAVGDVVINRHRQDLGLLGEEAHLLADTGHFDLRTVDVLAVHQDLPLNTDPVDRVEQAVEGLEEGRLTAAGGPDDGRDLSVRDVQRDVLQDVKTAIKVSRRVAPRANEASLSSMGTRTMTSSMARLMIGSSSKATVMIPARSDALNPTAIISTKPKAP